MDRRERVERFPRLNSRSYEGRRGGKIERGEKRAAISKTASTTIPPENVLTEAATIHGKTNASAENVDENKRTFAIFRAFFRVTSPVSGSLQ